MFNVTFNYTKGTSIMNFSGEITIKDMLSQYSDTLKSKNGLIFLSDGDILKIDSDKKISDCIKKETTILVLDDDAFEDNNDSSSMNKVISNQFKDKNVKGMKRDINKILEDMAIFGCRTKKLIDNTLAIGVNSYLSVDEAIDKGRKDPFYILGIFGKYLSNLGIKVVIDKNYGNGKDQSNNLSDTLLQFIFNGLIFKKKFCLYFNFDNPTIKKLHDNSQYLTNFKENLKQSIREEYGIPLNDITITNPIYDKHCLVIVLLKNDKISLTKEILFQKFQYIPDLCNLIDVKKENIIEGIILNRCMLDPNGDNKDGNWEYYAQRGGEDYLPPEGWVRYGLSVYNKYDNRNNDWLSYDHRKGEWCIAYSWLTYGKTSSNLESIYEKAKDIKHEGNQVGRGVFVTQNPEYMEEITESLTIKGKEIKLGLMLRVNPEKIRSPQSNDEIWVVDGYSDEIRPYGILIKEE